MPFDLDQLYLDWMDAEAAEQAALVMLGARDCIEYRAAAEAATEKRQAAEERYSDALAASASRTRPAGPTVPTSA